jgi:hypothetical protein
MALALSVDSLDGLPDAIHSLYVEQDGKFVLDLDGGIPDVTGLKSALESERAIAKAEAKAKKELEARYNGVDPDKYKEFLAKAEKAEEEKMILEGKQQELADRALKKRDEEWQKQLSLKDAELEAINSKVSSLRERALAEQIRSGINGAFHAMANDDAVFAALKMFSLDENGNAVMYDADGSIVIGKDGKTPFSPREWANSDVLKDTKPHWFAASLGGTGATQTNGSGGGKTMARAHFMTLSPSAQAKIMREGVVRVVDK